MTPYDELLSQPGELLKMWENMLKALEDQQREYANKPSTPENVEFYNKIELEISNVQETIKKLKQ